ncbi:hypothetical protein GMLC_10620 [Geomonas limicola]|uniref:Uncharacterized protein n=1 Tax=Geomonas limicola TaxID=2740186 RepID=A0A6V8N7F5_9BACT|nr:hypothetical protein [Geomonas limicola]GFO67483.1 hypothetical protein GMLC_10620 [Geomonas limicola]
MNNWSLAAVAEFVTDANLDRYTSACLPVPHPGIWPEEGRFPQLAESIERALPDPRKRTFYQTLLASFLMAPGSSPGCLLEWLSQRISIGELAGIPCGARELVSWTWRRVPIVLAGSVQNDVDRVKYLLVGCYGGAAHQLCPGWAERMLDTDARKALQAAGALARSRNPGKNFFFWPLIDPMSTATIQGPSLGLAAYLGAFSAACDLEVPSLLVTGALHEDGSIAEVDSLQQKYAAAKNYRGFIYPALTALDALAASGCDVVETLPVSRLVEAESLWVSYSPGSGRKIADFALLREDPIKLLAALPHIDPELVYSIQRDAEALSRTLGRSAGSATQEELEALLRFLRDMECILDRPNYDRRRAAAVLGLFDVDMVEQMIPHAPGAAFEIALLKTRLANHLGETGTQRQWQDIAERCSQRMPLRHRRERKLLYLVNRLNGAMHNTFSFADPIPAATAAEFDGIVGFFETQFRDELALEGKAFDFNLGCYYGTMMQHWAFRGPENLPTVESFSTKAREAFGNGFFPEYRDHYLRQYCYLAYAYLDAGKVTEAEGALNRYLETEDLSDFRFEEEGNPYKHAVLGRFLAETGRNLPAYVAWALENPHLKSQHPWQLWLYNMGHVADDPLHKEHYWRRSLETCLEPAAGEVIRAMGLLPLAALCGNRCRDRRFVESASGAVLQAVEGFPALRNQLRKVSHDCPSLFEMLAQLSGNLPVMFPFSYR